MQFIILLGFTVISTLLINLQNFMKFICYHTFILHITLRELFLMVNSLKTMIYFFLYHCNGIFFLYMFASTFLYECVHGYLVYGIFF